MGTSSWVGGSSEDSPGIGPRLGFGYDAEASWYPLGTPPTESMDCARQGCGQFLARLFLHGDARASRDDHLIVSARVIPCPHAVRGKGFPPRGGWVDMRCRGHDAAWGDLATLQGMARAMAGPRSEFLPHAGARCAGAVVASILANRRPWHESHSAFQTACHATEARLPEARPSPSHRLGSGNQLVHDLAVDVGEPEVTALEPVG